MSEALKDIDPDVQLNLRDLMQDDYRLLVDTFLADAAKRMMQLAQSLDSADWESFRQAAHSFKGSCGNMGAQALQQACSEAESAALSADATAARQAYQDLRRLFLRAEMALTH